MSILEMSEEEKKEIRKQHDAATKKFHYDKDAMNGGLKKPEKVKVVKKK